jgi:aldehyde dehydrogenase (NAD+)
MGSPATCGRGMSSARKVAQQLRAGNVNLNGGPNDRGAPFGGYKRSGNGREWGRFGLEQFPEVKAIAGFCAV